jgi:hypothetical protein
VVEVVAGGRLGREVFRRAIPVGSGADGLSEGELGGGFEGEGGGVGGMGGLELGGSGGGGRRGRSGVGGLWTGARGVAVAAA